MCGVWYRKLPHILRTGFSEEGDALFFNEFYGEKWCGVDLDAAKVDILFRLAIYWPIFF